MRYRPSTAFIVSLAFMFAAGGAGVWTFQKANQATPLERSQKSFFQLVTTKREIRPTFTFDGRSSREGRIATEKLIAALKLEYPALDTEERSVPDEENGFLQLFLLGNPPANDSPNISEGFQKILWGEGVWDADAARQALLENAELVEKIERIAAMTERSSMLPEYHGFVGARAGKYGAEIMMLKAQLAAESGDESEALRLVQGAFNICSHYSDLETGSLLCETIAILIDLNIRGAITKTILPALGSTADPEAWKRLMPASRHTPADFADVMRGEWETCARHMLFPMILDPRNREAPSDGEALARAFSADRSSQVTDLRTMNFQQFQKFEENEWVRFYKDLSKESRNMADFFF